ncbi:MAG: transposase, partial [Desulfomonilaceae bacterium]
MKDVQSLNHTRWDCKYHVVFIPKRRKKAIYGSIRKHLGSIFHELA